MGFEPDQCQSHVESVNKFKTRMEDALNEAKAALVKSKDNMAKYYDRRRTPAPEYQPGDKVYLDASDIHTTRPSRKLSHQRLGPFPVIKKVRNGEKEFMVEKILDSQIINQKLRYLIKWEGYGIEHNSWEPADDVHAPECVTEFHQNHPGAPHHIRFADFDTIPFQMLSSVVLGRHSLEGGVDVRGHPF